MLRRYFGTSILLGLEVLVAADLIRTVAVEPTMSNVLVLGLIVLIRTFLSFSLEIEMDGVVPWRRGPREARYAAKATAAAPHGRCGAPPSEARGLGRAPHSVLEALAPRGDQSWLSGLCAATAGSCRPARPARAAGRRGR